MLIIGVIFLSTFIYCLFRIDDIIKVNRSVPLLHLNGTNQSIRVSFIVDTGNLMPSDLGEDGLGKCCTVVMPIFLLLM